MSRSRRLRGSIGTAVLVTGIVAAAPAGAGAASHAVASSSTSTITLDGAFRKALRTEGVTLNAGRPATLAGAKVRLPITASATTTGTTTLAHGGSLTLRHGRHSAALTSWRTVVRAKTATVSAVLARKRIRLLTVSGGTFQSTRATGAVTVSGGRVALTNAGAKALRTRLRAPRLTGGGIGGLAVAAKPAAAPAAPATPTPVAPAPAVPATPPATLTTPAVPPADPPVTPPVDPPVDLCASPLTAATAGAAWAVKDSFLSYVQSTIANGSVRTCDGAAVERGTGGKVTLAYFAPTTTAGYQPDTGEVSVALGGSIHFTGHDSGKGPLLDMKFERLRVQSADGLSGSLVADVTSRPFGGTDPGATPPPAVSTTDVVLATLDLTGKSTTAADGTRTWAGVVPVLTDDGATAFGGFYPAGTQLAALRFKASAASLLWTQTNVADSTAPANTNRTWLGYVTNPTPFSGAQGTFTPSDGASGPVVTKTSDRGADKTYTSRFAVTSSTLSAATKTGIVRLHGLVTFASPGPAGAAGHNFTISVKDPRIVFDGSATAKLYATGTKTDSSTFVRSPYDETKPLFDLALGTTTANDDGTVTFAGLAPSIVEAGYAFPSNYAAGAGPERTPNTFGTFALTVPAGG